jgi:hypothetical protein
MRQWLFLILSTWCVSDMAIGQTDAKTLRVGIVGLDTSHVIAFTKLFNNPKAEGDLAGIQVVAGYPGGTDMPASRDRVVMFTEQLRGMGIEIVGTIPELMSKVDGRIHLQEAREIFKSGKPVFIDKPVAGSLADAIAIFELAKRHNVRCFSSSSSRFGDSIRDLLGNKQTGDILGAMTWGPCSYQSGTPDMFFYGVHGIEALYALMGTGCETVARTKAEKNDQVTGVWGNGRIGTYRGIVQGKSEAGAIVYGSQGIAHSNKASGYEPLCRAIGRFFRSGEPPVTPETTIELFAFMEAADESLRQGGKPVALADVLAKARAEATKILAR